MHPSRALLCIAAALACAAVGAFGSACVTPARHAVAAPVAHGSGTEMVEVRGTWLRVLETRPAGDAEDIPVVFVHGFGSRLDSWRLVQSEIAKTRRTLSYDQRGFGHSERTAGEYGPESHAADLHALLAQRGIERAIIVGHSYGGGVALRFALRHPERVAGVVLVAPFGIDEQVATFFRWAQLPGVGEALFDASWRGFAGEKYLLAFHDKHRFVSVAVLDEVEEIQAKPGAKYAELSTVRGMDYAEIERDYAKITAPITLVWGADDRVTPFKQSPQFLEKLPPSAKLVKVEQCGHVPSIERPAVVIDAINEVRP